MLIKGFGLSSIGALVLLSTSVYAAGFRVEFQSASVIADGGDAAAVEDASTNWYNSAGDVLLPQQLVTGMTIAYAPVEITGTSIAPNLASPLVAPYVASGKSSSHTTVELPQFHYVVPVDPYWSLGLSVVPAWGFIEDYGENAILRYNAIRIYTKTIMLSPSVSWRLNNSFSMGIGPDFHYFATQSRTAINTAITGVTGDSISHFSGSDWQTGFHIGALYQFSPCIRIGLNYRGKLVVNEDGYSDFDGQVAGLPEPNQNHANNFKIRLNLPPVTTLSGYWAVTPNIALLATTSYEQWSVLKAYYATNYASSDSFLNVVLPQDFTNTWDFAVGTKYTLNDTWAFRATGKYVDTPTINAHREPLLPDSSKWVLHVGAHYQYNRYIGFDVQYGHVWFRDAQIHAFNPVTFATTDGHMKSHAELFGGQIVWTVC